MPGYHFNPQGPRGPRRLLLPAGCAHLDISIHKALAGLDVAESASNYDAWKISIHKALAGLDIVPPVTGVLCPYFDPQGPRGPRLCPGRFQLCRFIISIHKALAGLDENLREGNGQPGISIHKALAGLDHRSRSWGSTV